MNATLYSGEVCVKEDSNNNNESDVELLDDALLDANNNLFIINNDLRP